MRKPTTTVTVGAGPKVAVREMEANGISTVFVVDHERRLKGLVTIDDAIDAVKSKKSLKDILRKEYETTDPETFIQDLIETAVQSKYPIAVIDDNEKLLGIIVRVSVLAGLV